MADESTPDETSDPRVDPIDVTVTLDFKDATWGDLRRFVEIGELMEDDDLLAFDLDAGEDICGLKTWVYPSDLINRS